MNEKALLVGDNPFHSISHLSQERSRTREKSAAQPDYAADLIHLAVTNGANGFMFSVDQTTLEILEIMRSRNELGRLELYAIVPYAYEYVRLATQAGGFAGLAKRLGKQLLTSGNFGAMASGLKGVLAMNPEAVMRTYLSYEISRIRSAAGKQGKIESILLHEVLTDMALALNLNWLFEVYVNFLNKHKITPGFNTCNFACLTTKLADVGVDLNKVVIAAPFNAAGFQMSPSKAECEKALVGLGKPLLVAISILAGGYLGIQEAVDYVASLPNLKGVAVGISKPTQASETFGLLKNRLTSKHVV